MSCHGADLWNGFSGPADIPRDGVEARTSASAADDFCLVSGVHFASHCLSLANGLSNGIGDDAVTGTLGTGTHFRVVGEEPGVEFGETEPAFRTSPIERIESSVRGRDSECGSARRCWYDQFCTYDTKMCCSDKVKRCLECFFNVGGRGGCIHKSGKRLNGVEAVAGEFRQLGIEH